MDGSHNASHHASGAELSAEVTELVGVKPTPAEYRNMGDLWTMKKAAMDAFNDGAKALAEKYGIDVSELKAYINAKEQDKLAEHEKKLNDRQLLMDL